MKRRIEVDLETKKVVVLRRRGQTIEAWCEDCAESVQLLSAEQAALILGVSLRELVRETDADHFHYQETEEGRLFLCLNSLKRQKR